LNEHPDTIFTVLTGEGRFFSAGADIRGNGVSNFEAFETNAEAKLAFSRKLLDGVELLRSIIDHKKVFVLALNGPGVGGGAAWFSGIADLVFAAEDTFLQVPFSALGLVPENGSAINFAQSMGVHRTNEFLMFGRRLTAQELEQYGVVNKIFPTEGFQDSVKGYLQKQINTNDGKSMLEMKRLQNAPLRDVRMLAVHDSMDALAERFVEGAPFERFALKKQELEAKSKNSSKL